MATQIKAKDHGTAVEPLSRCCRIRTTSERHRKTAGCQQTSSMTVEDVVRTNKEGFNRAADDERPRRALSGDYMRMIHAVRPDGSVLGKEEHVLRDLGTEGLRFHVDRISQRQRPDLRPDSAHDRC